MERQNSIRLVVNVICLCFILLLSSCSTVNPNSSTTSPYWNENDSDGSISTNDLEKLQKEIPFTITSPKYLPDGLQAYDLDAVFHYIHEYPTLTIYYYHKTKLGEISILEGPPEDSIIRPLPPGLFTKMNPDFTPINPNNINSNIEILETSGIEDHIIKSQKTEVLSIYYIWEKDNLDYSLEVLGFDKVEARKILESMFK
jgi:hypothetical protein